MQIIPYLTFDGNCRQAMAFYEKCLGGDLHVMTFGESPMDSPPEAKDRIIHARLINGSAILMASDGMPGRPIEPGSNFSVSIACDSVEQTDAFFSAMSEGGDVTMAVQDAFWGARFGMLTDQFGIKWMFNYEYPKQG